MYLLLEKEINNLKEIKEGVNLFLVNTLCSYLLDKLTNKKDVKSYFKLIKRDAMEELENKNSKSRFQIDIKKAAEEIKVNK